MLKHKLLLTLSLSCSIAFLPGTAIAQNNDLLIGHTAQIQQRATLATVPVLRSSTPLAIMSPQQRRQAIDAYWGPGPSTAEKLQIFDKFWSYVDVKFAAFQGIDVD